ncbi:hypothetical protein MA16_Dca011106 [Dendrobium catenatum]|uniref:Uncharacterized protein n=1 Tax=Dendrobium catenatum TaxID=906689 RepID=A0A2I0WS92_9ASPA|nr:hypothetical protein MA16_Dca011106 [Dendrobium catenatum]
MFISTRASEEGGREGVKDASDKKILVDMLFWAVDNRPPANYLLISGDRDFSNALHQLSMRRYNILLAQPRNVSQALTAAAKTVWSWTDLLAGGPPLSPFSITNENGSTSETSINSAVEANKPCDSPSSNTDMAYQKANVNEKGDNQVKGKQQALKIQRQQSGNKSRITRNEGMQYHSGSLSLTGITQISQIADKTISNTEAFPKAHTNFSDNNPSIPTQTLINSPHKINGSQKPEMNQLNAREATKPSTIVPYCTNGMVSVSNNFNDSQCPPHLLKPLGTVHSRPYQQPVNFTYSTPPMLNCYPQSTWHNGPVFIKGTPRPQTGTTSELSSKKNAPIFRSSKPNDPSFSLGSPQIVPDISKLNIAQYPNPIHHNTFSYPTVANIPQSMLPCNQENMQSNDISWNPSGPPVIHSPMDTILSALRILRKEKMPPTEANITDCIRYGEMNIQDFNVSKALELAVQHHLVVKHKLGDNLFYISKGESLWKCVNVMDSQIRHSKAVCDVVLKFLSSTDGHSSMMASRCMYDAASILKRSCLKSQALGEVLQILNAAIHQKKWILPHSSGWQPLSLLLPTIAVSDMNAEAQST